MLSSITTPSTLTDSFGITSNAINPDRISATQVQDPAEKKKKKKKKRALEDDQTATTETVNGDEQRKKKKRKHHDPPEQHIAPPAIEAPSEPAQASKPKKKKKDKGKAKDTTLAEQTDAQIEADSQASAEALLSAIVAASVTSPEAPQVSPPYDPQMAPLPSQQFTTFPPMQYGYPPGPFDPTATQPPSIFAAPTGPVGGAFSELAFGSNEDLLRALQDLDMSKIASVLRTLGEAAMANEPSFIPQLSFLPTQLDQLPPPPPARRVAIQSNAPVKLTSTSTGHKRTINMDLPGNEQHSNPDHAYLLANKWLGANKLAELVKREGLVYKKGKFSAIEEEQLRVAIEKYQQEKGLAQNQIQEMIFSKTDKSKDTAFWSELTSAVPLRPIIAVYHHVRRSHHPLKQQGPWGSNEDDALKQAVADLGQQWEKVSYRVGRMASDCRDRYRNHIVNSDIRITGHWSAEEEEKLTRIVTDMTIKQGKDIDNDVFWGKVSELMGGTRGRQQCRIKWTDALSKTVKNEGRKPRWNAQDAFILVHKVDSLNVRDDTEIDWKLIPDPDWNLWSAHTLQRRWLTLKKGVKGYEDMTHQEIMDILRVKKADLPPPPIPSTRKKKERKVTSAAAVSESPDSRASNDTPAAAGSSTGPGTSTTRSSQGQDDDSTDSDS